MLSSDKNIQSIEQLLTVVKEYISIEEKHLRLELTEKLIRLCKGIIFFLIVLVLSIGVLFYLSSAFVSWLIPLMGEIQAYSAMAALFLFMIIIVACKRRSWIERPLTRFFANIILK